MQIAKHKVVSIDYTLKVENGQILDTSEDDDPLSYLHGEGNIVPGLEDALDGKTVGDQLQVTVQPADGYGERIDELRQVVDRDSFKDVPDLEVGMQFRLPAEEDAKEDAEEDEDEFVVVTVVEVSEDTVTIDGNHELAGEILHFDVSVRDIRDATPEEIDHGHAHIPGDHD